MRDRRYYDTYLDGADDLEPAPVDVELETSDADNRVWWSFVTKDMLETWFYKHEIEGQVDDAFVQKICGEMFGTLELTYELKAFDLMHDDPQTS
jgi:hypothetical protein